MQPAVFFDRDDTLVQDTGYLHKIADFKWVSGAKTALQTITRAGIPIFIITNQGGIGKGLFSIQDMHSFNQYLCAQARNAGAKITDIAFCPHHPEAVIEEFKTPCDCRKPEAGMILALAQKWQIDTHKSVVIGDRNSDIEAGRKAGCTSFLLEPKTSLPCLAEKAISHIIGENKR